jgi:zinc transport system ATP-binding protein
VSEAPLLRCERLVIGYGGRALLPACDLTLRPGTLVLVLGRNGSGKSTFFRTVLGLLPPVSGTVTRRPGVRVAYVGQGHTLDRGLPLRARDVVSWGLHSGWSFLRRPPGGRAACDRALAEAGVPELADRIFPTLSEGQKQRVLLARLLAARPQVGFLDEPTAAMDAVAEEHAIAHLAELARGQGMAIVVISHTLGLAGRFADEVVFLDRDDGVIVHGTPSEVLAHPSFRRQFGVLELPPERRRQTGELPGAVQEVVVDGS